MTSSFTSHTTHQVTHRSGYTLVELVLVITIISILTAVLVPSVASVLDQIDVHGATADAESIFAAARHTAIAIAAPVTVEIDTANQMFVVHTGTDTIRNRDEAGIHGVHLHATRTSMSYSPTGMGYGVANLTLVITKHAFADTVVVSRLGRVRTQ